jgi:hypothetical protein
VRFETLEAEHHYRWGFVDFNRFSGLNMVFANIAIPSVFLIKFFRQAEMFKTFLDFRMSRGRLDSRLSISWMTIITDEHRDHIFTVSLYYSVVEYEFELECQVSGLIILSLFIFILILNQVIIALIFLFGGGILQASETSGLDFSGLNEIDNSVLILVHPVLTFLESFLLSLEVISIQTIEIIVVQKTLSACQGFNELPDG